jgi:zinc D-Ala-D-Ala carboxypeptidase
MRDLNAKIPGAEGFTYKEFVKSDTATRKGIKNEPTEEQWKCIELLAKEVLQPIRNEFGRIRITSGFRSVELCEAVGSSSKSNHTRGEASDIEPLEKGITLFDILEFIHDNLEYRELIAEFFPAGWIHVAYREGGNIKKLKLKDDKHNYEEVSLNYLKTLYDV